MLQMQGAQVPSLVQELRSHMLHSGQTEKKMLESHILLGAFFLPKSQVSITICTTLYSFLVTIQN